MGVNGNERGQSPLQRAEVEAFWVSVRSNRIVTHMSLFLLWVGNYQHTQELMEVRYLLRRLLQVV